MATTDHHDITGTAGAAALNRAFQRATETTSECPLFTDPYAPMFVDAAIQRGWRPPSGELAERLRALSDYTAARTKYCDEFLIAAGAVAITQAVLVGSGLDARAWRLPWLADSVVFDIDCPEILEFKRATLTACRAQPAARYVGVPIDPQSDWSAGLRGAGFDPSLPTAWCTEELLARLPPDALGSLLDRIRSLSAPSSRVAVEALPDQRAGLVDRLRQQGWAVTVTPITELLVRYRRVAREGVDHASAPSVLVEGRLRG
ncbi:SAM-dependent methyltransferase [Mycobacterium botniense]|uniref:S-adenosyl-L-methionine-dependent methyltransferase n=1 Tax=Mycobacterium botniense TaxID=84962 RepID=A0A7I9XTZ0_9MYCO|nr:SAM-dependent methyltransferase [Mycobacterium botniense]GFG73454.1 putative S-adenosyl-L-methionine-dependent methyltransferase [Mycobacterium botniense]